MAEAHTREPSEEGATSSLFWLYRFRWFAVAGQAGALCFVQFSQGLGVRWGFALALLGVVAVSNIWLLRWTRANETGLTRASGFHRVALRILLLDTASLTFVLLASGGIENPFSLLYLAQIVLGALLLDTRYTTWVTAASAAGFGLLFVADGGGLGLLTLRAGAHAHHVQHSYSSHLTGMGVAFATVASTVAYFAHQISRHIQDQARQITALREQALRTSHLAALATLAAGAAHELRTPLSTIVVALHELKRGVGDDAAARADVQLIEEEVQRCQSILGGMAPRFDSTGVAPPPRELGPLLRDALADAAASPDCQVEVDVGTAPLVARIREEELYSAIQQLVDNSLHAAAGKAVKLVARLRREGALVRIEFEDDGPGMSDEVRARAQDPFYTTKRAGEGLGLGLFLVHTFALSAHGTLGFEVPRGGRGTRVVLRLPLCEGGVDGA